MRAHRVKQKILKPSYWRTAAQNVFGSTFSPARIERYNRVQSIVVHVLCLWQVEVLDLPKKELEAYRKFEKALQKEYLAVRHRLLTVRGSHTMAVLTLLSKFRQVNSNVHCLLRLSMQVSIFRCLRCAHTVEDLTRSH